jgi:hypothetical protein
MSAPVEAVTHAGIVPGAASGEPARQAEEQQRYASWLQWGTRAGLALLLACFAAYLTGWMAPLVPLEQLPSLWSLPVRDYLRQSGTPPGWGWLALAAHGDIANLAGIAVLASCSLPPLLALVPLFAARGERALAALCVAEVVVLLVAASGLPGTGH